jgi:hypothetical protein
MKVDGTVSDFTIEMLVPGLLDTCVYVTKMSSQYYSANKWLKYSKHTRNNLYVTTSNGRAIYYDFLFSTPSKDSGSAMHFEENLTKPLYLSPGRHEFPYLQISLQIPNSY